MSIIYDALQKTQRNREYLRLQGGLIQKKPYRRHIKMMVFGVFVLLVSAGVGAVVSFYLQPAQTLKAEVKLKPKATPPAMVKTAPVQSLESAHVWVSTEVPKASVHQLPPLATAVAQNSTAAPSLSVTPSVVASSQPATVQPAFKSKLILNGVMIAGLEKIALINNQSFRIGDVIAGMKIISIDFNSVKLQEGGNVMELKVPV